jgi:hypothetical protein
MIAWNGPGAQDCDITFSRFDIKRFPSYSFCVMMSSDGEHHANFIAFEAAASFRSAGAALLPCPW